jgi:ABC-2 type transport system ATP-binding protein
VSDLSFEVGNGEVVGFLGPNGAGKTTTLRILAGFLGATAGCVRINGFDIVEQSLQARRCIGYMPEATPLYPELKVREYLEFRAAAKRVPRRQRAAAIDRVLGLASLTDVADTLVLHLSKGYRQRVGLADALVSSPPLLILDEPTIGLDPNQIRDVRRLIRALGSDHTILLSTHILSEVESTCDRAMVIDRGRLVASGTIAELRELRRSETVRLVVRDPEGRARSLLEETAGVQRATPEADAGGRDDLVALTVTIAPDVTDRQSVVEQVVAKLVAAKVAVRELSQARATLEEVFAQLTRAGDAQPDASDPKDSEEAAS